MTTEKSSHETPEDAPTPTISGAAWKEGVIPTPSAPALSATGRDANPHPERAADIAPDMKDGEAPIGEATKGGNGPGIEEVQPATSGSSLRHWITFSLVAVGLAALLAKIKK